MDAHAVLTEAFGRVRDGARRLCEGLDEAALTWRPGPDANTIAWLLWHTGRVGDAQVADLAEREERWTEDGWADRLDLPFAVQDTGYGHTPEQVAQVRPDDAGLLVDYVDAAIDLALEHLETLDAGALDRVVDRRFDPPVTAGVRLVSIVHDQSQHLGQAAYVRGMYERAARD